MSRIRRSSMLQTQTSEPLIVVEENEDSEKVEKGSCSSDDESPMMNPLLLSPFARDIRKHSLPTPQCSGITASQVRRLSERSETSGPGPRQTEFLATLSTAPQPTPGGRRHSVVTISRVPPAFFGRSRRESVAVFPSRLLPNRRESIACPPSEPLGSVHNLQLDIMDDIVQARKVRMKLWSTSSEKVCEVQSVGDTDPENVQRFHGSSRRYSDFVGTTLAPIPSSGKRRASELPVVPSCGTSSNASKHKSSGIVCSNTDLMSILSSLSTSAMEINGQCEARCKDDVPRNGDEKKRRLLKNTRSNSFDIAIIYKAKTTDAIEEKSAPSNWFVKRHQPKDQDQKSTFTTLPAKVKPEESPKSSKVVSKEPGKVLWDERIGSMVDVHAIGSAIEVFLRKVTPDVGSSSASPSCSPGKKIKQKSPSGRSRTAWFSSRSDEDSTETCESSLCSTLKDLFVK